MAFWGIEVKPFKPVVHSCENARGRLRITQATLGIGVPTERNVVVQCKVGNRIPVVLCTLIPTQTGSCRLELEFEEADYLVFSVIGPWSVFLTGYYVCKVHLFNPQSDTESHGVDIENSHTQESSLDSHDDKYEESFLNDSELEVHSQSPVSSNNEDDENTTENDNLKNKKGRGKLLKKKTQIVETDGDDSCESEDWNMPIFKSKKAATKIPTVATKRTAQATVEKGLKMEIDDIVGKNGESERAKMRKKWKECSEEKSGADKRQEIDASTNMEIGDCKISKKVHSSWKTLILEGPTEKFAEDRDFDCQRLAGLVQELSQRPHLWGIAADALFAILHPSLTHIVEPAAIHTRGRPKNKFCARTKTTWEEHKWSKKRELVTDESPVSIPQGRGRDRARSSGRGRGPIPERTPYYYDSLHAWLGAYLVGHKDVEKDGNCGYRCVAHIVKGDEDRWDEVKGDLVRELHRNVHTYRRMFGSVEYTRIIDRVSWFKKGVVVPLEKWMSIGDVTFAIANVYNAIVVCYDKRGSSTFLPTQFPPGVSQVALEIWIMYFDPSRHFISLMMTGDTPLPSIYPMWRHYRTSGVAHLEGLLDLRIQQWKCSLPTSTDSGRPRSSSSVNNAV